MTSDAHDGLAGVEGLGQARGGVAFEPAEPHQGAKGRLVEPTARLLRRKVLEDESDLLPARVFVNLDEENFTPKLQRELSRLLLTAMCGGAR